MLVIAVALKVFGLSDGRLFDIDLVALLAVGTLMRACPVLLRTYGFPWQCGRM
jgi:hypothetical protein